MHAAVDTLGHLLALNVTAADEQDRAQVERLAAAVQPITGEHVELGYVDQVYTEKPRLKLPPRMASNWRWSSIPKPSEASCCCPEDGW